MSSVRVSSVPARPWYTLARPSRYAPGVIYSAIVVCDLARSAELALSLILFMR